MESRKVKKSSCLENASVSRRAVNFVYVSTPGRKVMLAGSFNNWQPVKQLKDRDNNGVYRCQLRLEPGEYQYKFIVDGDWCLDAENPNFTQNGFGSLNSVLTVIEK